MIIANAEIIILTEVIDEKAHLIELLKTLFWHDSSEYLVHYIISLLYTDFYVFLAIIAHIERAALIYGYINCRLLPSLRFHLDASVSRKAKWLLFDVSQYLFTLHPQCCHTQIRIDFGISLTSMSSIFLCDCDISMCERLTSHHKLHHLLLGFDHIIVVGWSDEINAGHFEFFSIEIMEWHPEDTVIAVSGTQLSLQLFSPFV
jgi:hypothetical protein